MLLLSYSLYVNIDVLIIVGGTYYMKHSIISLVMRVCGVIICSILLLNCPVAPMPNGNELSCLCMLIFLLYLAVCGFATYYNWEEYTGKSIVTCIISIIIGVPLSIASFISGHLICSGVLLLVTIVSVAMEYSDIKE